MYYICAYLPDQFYGTFYGPFYSSKHLPSFSHIYTHIRVTNGKGYKHKIWINSSIDYTKSLPR